jgi:hypothetical protein
MRPVFHYGLIVSGIYIMRHGATQETLGAEHDILCFEMDESLPITCDPWYLRLSRSFLHRGCLF